MELFDEKGVEHVIHCGDIGGTDVFDELVGRPCHFVWGNCDRPSAALRSYLETVGLTEPDEVPLRLTLGGKCFAVLHGHEAAARRIESISNADYILHGHSHVRRDERIGTVRIINPGALYRARTKTVAILDPTTDELTFCELPSHAGRR